MIPTSTKAVVRNTTQNSHLKIDKTFCINYIDPDSLDEVSTRGSSIYTRVVDDFPLFDKCLEVSINSLANDAWVNYDFLETKFAIPTCWELKNLMRLMCS